MKIIVVASINPVKVNAVKQGFQKVFPNEKFLINALKVSSQVSNQPINDKETLQGALNRAINSYKIHPKAHFWVGIEGGIENRFGQMQAFAWIVIKSLKKYLKQKLAPSFYLQK